jgi:hypothetical protein
MTVLQAAAVVCVLAIACIPPSVCAMEPSGNHSPELVSAGQFPAAGHSYSVDFGRSKFRLDFTSDKEMTFTSLVDPTTTETVKIAVTQLRPNLFMVAWTEKAGNRVVHVEDFEHMVIYTNIVRKDGTFVRLKGSITELK